MSVEGGVVLIACAYTTHIHWFSEVKEHCLQAAALAAKERPGGRLSSWDGIELKRCLSQRGACGVEGSIVFRFSEALSRDRKESENSAKQGYTMAF